MSQVLPPAGTYDAEVDVAIVGGGAAGLTAALRLAEAGASCAVLERDARPTGSTAMSSGFVPAPGTKFQRMIGIDDTPEEFARDIQKKAADGADPDVVAAVTQAIGPALEWLAAQHGLDWQVLDDFLYPGHSRHRMHAVPEKTGAGLMQRLYAAAETAGVPVLTEAQVVALHRDNQRICGVTLERPDGSETVACKALILACNGYGGNPDLVTEHIPEIAAAPYYGHAGNTGDAVRWGQALGADLQDLTAYQGHGSLAAGHNILITWALMMEGGIQVNAHGQRFANEHRGYSEQAVDVLAQPGGVAWNIYDQRVHDFGLGFPDYRSAVAAGAVIQADDVEDLARKSDLPETALTETLLGVWACAAGAEIDPLGRVFTADQTLETPPYYAIKVTGALFHTQGGLSVNAHAQVLVKDGISFPNLFAVGGAARGVSGARVEGYLSGNGLLTAIGLGDIAGRAAAALVRKR